MIDDVVNGTFANNTLHIAMKTVTPQPTRYGKPGDPEPEHPIIPKESTLSQIDLAQPQIHGYKPNPADPDNPYPAGLGTICDELYQAAAGNPRSPDKPLPGAPPELWKIVGIKNSHDGKLGAEASTVRLSPRPASTGFPTWLRCCSARRTRRGGEHPMTQRMDKESTSHLVKLIIFCVLTGMATVVLGMTLSNGGFARRRRLQGDVHRRHRCGRAATKSASLVFGRQHPSRWRSRTRTRPSWSSDRPDIKLRRTRRRLAVPQPGRPALQALERVPKAPPPRSSRAQPSRYREPGRPSTLTCCWAVSSRCSRRSTRPTSTSWRLRSSRHCRRVRKCGEPAGISFITAQTLAGRDKLIGDVIRNLSTRSTSSVRATPNSARRSARCASSSVRPEEQDREDQCSGLAGRHRRPDR